MSRLLFWIWSLSMLISVTLLAQGDAIANIITKLSIVMPRFDVVRVKIAATIISAFLTRKAVPHIHLPAPSFVLCGMPLTVVQDSDASLPRVVIRTPK